ncbi:MAG: hypothetical protein HGA96_06530 [Desulfobulbaceae bacterium]|nr:hypothetical protein [Desulfobulbaceae bacterium]
MYDKNELLIYVEHLLRLYELENENRDFFKRAPQVPGKALRISAGQTRRKTWPGGQRLSWSNS